MPTRRWPLSTLALAAALVVMQGSLWLGRDNMPQVIALTSQLADQKATNRAAEQRNAQVVAELSDLRDGEEMVQERARSELGLVKEREVLVQYTRRATPGKP
jgi:cell division protein FtsB